MNKSRRPTGETISALAGVSSSTVSRALKGDPVVSKKTRERILAIAEELGYKPNAMARGLVTQRSGVIGFIVGDLTNPFYTEQMERLLAHLSKLSMQLMLFYVPTGADVADILPSLFEYQLDGCIIAAVPMSSKAGEICARQQLPTVLINRLGADQSVCSVLCNNFAGGYQAARHLVRCGRTRCALIAGRPNTLTAVERERGFIAGLEACGQPLHGRGEGNYDFKDAYEAMLGLARGQEPPDGVFAANDVMALAALDALRALGIPVPDEMAVIGFDGINAAGWPSYGLTTIAQPADALIARAVDLLMQRIDDPSLPPELITLNGTMVVRQSTPPLDDGTGEA